jgi:hypothetical protein
MRVGYTTAQIYINGKSKSLLVYKLVVKAFLPPKPSPTHQIRHLNGDPLDSRVCNLAWGTPKENAADKEQHGTVPYGTKHPNAKVTEQDVREIRQLLSQGSEMPPLARRFNLSKQSIYRIAHRRSWRHV